jgi:hypothetical protein
MKNTLILIITLWANLLFAQSIFWADSTLDFSIGTVDHAVVVDNKLIFSTGYSNTYYNAHFNTVVRRADPLTGLVLDSIILGNSSESRLVTEMQVRNDTVFLLVGAQTQSYTDNRIFIYYLKSNLQIMGIDTLSIFSFQNSPLYVGEMQLYKGLMRMPCYSYDRAFLVEYDLNLSSIRDTFSDRLNTGCLGIVGFGTGSYLINCLAGFLYVDSNYNNPVKMRSFSGTVGNAIALDDTSYLFAAVGGGPNIGICTVTDTFPRETRLLPIYDGSVNKQTDMCLNCVQEGSAGEVYFSFIHDLGLPVPGFEVSTLAIYRYNYTTDSVVWLKTIHNGHRIVSYGLCHSEKATYVLGTTIDLDFFPNQLIMRPFIYAIDSTGSFLSSQEHFNDNCLSLRTNLVSDQLNIQLCKRFSALSYSIFSIAGKELLNGQMEEYSSAINVESLSKGIYFIRVETDGRIYTQRFVKQGG